MCQQKTKNNTSDINIATLNVFFVSLLDRISVQQSSKDISTEPHTHQNIKNTKNITKTAQKHYFNILKSSLNAK